MDEYNVQRFLQCVQEVEIWILHLKTPVGWSHLKEEKIDEIENLQILTQWVTHTDLA